MRLEIIFLIITFIYLLRTIFFSIGFKIQRKKSFSYFYRDELPFVTVLIPARNEQKNIRRCIESLAKSHYPIEKYEILIVNDRSSDRTSKIANSLKKDIPNLNVIDLIEERSGNLLGKAGALQMGIEAAKGEYILMTDADCKTNYNWIQTMVDNFESDQIGMIASFTLIKGKKLFTIMQGIEWIYMEAMASGGLGLNQPLGCFGNNIAVKKSDFMELGGYRNIKFSVTEDLALLQAMFRSGKNIKYICNPEATVKTLPCKSLHEYIRQHKRWTIGGKGLGWRATLFVGSSFAIYLGIALGIIFNRYDLAFYSYLTRVVGDFFLIFPTLNALNERKLKPWVFVAISFFLIVELIVPFLIIDPRVRWKGQTFK